MFSVPRFLQELPPWAAHLCLDVERFVSEELGIAPGTGLVVACSGGADSTALTIIWHCLMQRHGGSMAVAHLDHGLRDESSEDAVFVKDLCIALDVPFFSQRADVAFTASQLGLGLEETGRKLRYAFFEKIRMKTGLPFVATAHHLNDLAEDVLLRLCRGTGWPGLGGMTAHDAQRRLVRPLLSIPRSDLIHFLQTLHFPWREDDSNTDVRFARNRMRHSLLPLILEENPNFLKGINRIWRQAGVDRAYWEQRLENFPGMKEEPFFLSRDRLADLHQAERLRLYKSALDKLGPGQVLTDTLLRLDAAFLSGKPATLQFPGRKVGRSDSKGIHFGPDPRWNPS